MAKFVYRMQNILNVKYKLEEQAKSAYALAAQRLRTEEEALARLVVRKAQYEQQSREQLKERLDIRAIRTGRNAVEAMKRAIKQQSIAVQIAQKNLDNERAKLNEVMIDRKTHEKLRENAFEEFKREVNAEESKEIDQLVSYNYSNKESNGG